jgi:RNA-binding protein YhbY
MNDRPLTDTQKTKLREQATTLAVAFEVREGALTPEFYAKLGQHFKKHELAKVSLPGAARPKRAALIAHLVKNGACSLVGTEGSVALLYRATGA